MKVGPKEEHIKLVMANDVSESEFTRSFPTLKTSLCEVEEERDTENRDLPRRTGFERGGRMEVTAHSLMGSTKGLWKGPRGQGNCH